MEELIFIALILFFSIVESIARKRKQRSGAPGLPGEVATDDDESRRGAGRAGAGEHGWSTTPMPTYDAERSYDDLEIERAEASRQAPPRPQSSEGMIPADLWKEIEKLSRGERAETPRPGPAPKPREPIYRPTSAARPRPTGQATRPTVSSRPRPPAPAPVRAEPVARRAEGHRIHLAHEGFGTDPSERAPSPQHQIDPLARRLNADAAAARGQLRHRDLHALRQAVILQEILALPVALRPERFSE